MQHRSNLTFAQLGFMALVATFLFLGFSDMALAQGLPKVNSFFETVLDLMKGVGVVIVAIAVMWCGYKMIFKGASFSEVSLIFVGGLLIGSATAIAGFLIPAG